MPDVVSPPTPLTLQTVLAPGLAAVRKFWRPFLLLQSAALLLVIGYYDSSHIQAVCEQLSQFKQRGGLVFSAISAAFAGAILPELAKTIVMGDRTLTRKRLRDVRFALFAFAGTGIITDLQYRWFAVMFGNDTHATTVIKKMLFDMLITTPLYGVPYWLIIYSWRAHGYNLPATLGQISPRWYVHRALPLLIPAWCFWVPMVLLIYALPGPLQFCLYCFALAAWSLLMVFVATHKARADSTMK